MKKQTLCSCFTWITFIEINFSFISVNKETWKGRFAGKVGDGEF